jgi:hypothetical protein
MMAYTKTFVSKNALSLISLPSSLFALASSFMCFFAVEDESGREGTPELAQSLQSSLTALIAPDLEGTAADDSNLDIVALLELQRFDDSGWQADRQAVSPLGNLHSPPWIYISQCISIA